MNPVFMVGGSTVRAGSSKERQRKGCLVRSGCWLPLTIELNGFALTAILGWAHFRSGQNWSIAALKSGRHLCSFRGRDSLFQIALLPKSSCTKAQSAGVLHMKLHCIRYSDSFHGVFQLSNCLEHPYRAEPTPPTR